MSDDDPSKIIASGMAWTLSWMHFHWKLCLTAVAIGFGTYKTYECFRSRKFESISPLNDQEIKFMSFLVWLKEHNVQAFYDPKTERMVYSDEDPLVGYIEDHVGPRKCLICQSKSWNEDLAPFCTQCYDLCIEKMGPEQQPPAKLEEIKMKEPPTELEEIEIKEIILENKSYPNQEEPQKHRKHRRHHRDSKHHKHRHRRHHRHKEE